MFIIPPIVETAIICVIRGLIRDNTIQRPAAEDKKVTSTDTVSDADARRTIESTMTHNRSLLL